MNLTTFQEALKDETQDLHTTCQNHPFMQTLINGTYKKEHLLLFLKNILPFYKLAEERYVTPYILNNETINSTDLFRTPLIEQDIALLQNELQTEPTPVFDIVDNWVQLSQNIMPLYLKAEIYTRWLADFYGGQTLQSVVTPNNMYTCTNTELAIKNVRKMLDWGPPLPRIGITARLGITARIIIARAKQFFELHIKIFDKIYNDV
jgi:heme oxygenase